MDEEAAIRLFDEESMDELSVDATGIDIDDIQSTPSVCLIINQEYQQQLEEFIASIEDKLEENRERQKFLSEKISKKATKKVTTSGNSYIDFITPYFRDFRGLHPPPNEDTKLKQQNGELNLNHVSAARKWSPLDEAQLLSSIKEFYMRDQLEQLRTERSRLLLDMRVYENDRFRLEQVRDDLAECERRILKSLDSGLVSVCNDLQEKIDWLYVSRQMDDLHDNLNCKLYWVNYLHPAVNKDDWSTEETDRLGELLKNQENFDWERIAQKLGTNRKAWQVAKQYQITFNSSIKHNGPFSDEEIGHLSTVIEKCRIGHYIPWNQVYYFFDGRTIFQIKQFWKKHMRRDAKKDYWTLLEDTVLQMAFNKYRVHWKKIASYLPGRSNRQCRERYINRLSIRRHRFGNWSMAEDRRIIELAEQTGGDYWQIKAALKNRSVNQIRSRHRVLMRAKATGLTLSYKKNRTWELGTVRLNYLADRCRRIKNVDTFLNSARQTLLDGVDREQARKDDLDLLNARLARKNLTKLKHDEERVDNEIIKMFDHYNLIPTKFHRKPNCTTPDNLCFDDALTRYLHSLLNGHENDEDYLLNNVLRYLFRNEITDFSPSHNEPGNQQPAVLPPNKTTMLAFFGVLMQKSDLQKLLEENESQEELLGNFDLDALRADPEYARLAGVFQSLFLLPAILTDTRLPGVARRSSFEDDEAENNSNQSNGSAIDDERTPPKGPVKRKRSLKIRHERQAKVLTTTKIRMQQKALVCSYFEFKKAKRSQ